MVQTRVEAAALVVSLQKAGLLQCVALYAVAALAASACITAAIVLIAVAAPPEWRVLALGLVVLLLLLAAVWAAVSAGRRLRRDAALIADFSKGLRLDMATVNLVLKDPETADEEEIEPRERAKGAAREAAAAQASKPGTAGGGAISPTGPSVAAASAAMSAASPAAPDANPAGSAVAMSQADATNVRSRMRVAMLDPGTEPAAETALAGSIAEAATEREIPEAPVTPPEAMTTRPSREHTTHGSA